MSSRLVFRVKNAEVGEQIVSLLRSNGVEDTSISILGKDQQPRNDLTEAGEFENDAVPAGKRGALIGGATGLLAGLGAVVVAPGLALGGAAVALAAAGGATFGVLASSMIGSSVPNSQLREYEDAVERGELLMVVEVDDERREQVTALLHEKFPSIELHGELDSVPPIV